MTEWTDLFERQLKDGDAINLAGEFRGTIIEEIGKGVDFTMQPGVGADYAPLIDGDPYVIVTLPSRLDDQIMYKMQFACRENGFVKVRGTYHPETSSDRLGIIMASHLEF